MKKQFLEIGKIVSVSGINGEVRVDPWCDGIDFIKGCKELYFDEGKEQVKLIKARQNKNVIVLKLSCADNIDEANSLRGKILYVNRDHIKLPHGSYFIEDLIGTEVVDADNPDISYGKICDITKTGANDVYHVKSDDKTVLVPAIKKVIIDTDIERGIMKIRPITGLFDDNEAVIDEN